MREFKNITLKNGLRLILTRDTNINTCQFALFINFGNVNQEIIIDNKKFDIKKYAYFLCCCYDDLESSSLKNSEYFNNYTGYKTTSYALNTRYYLKYNIKKLITSLHTKMYTPETIPLIKERIIKKYEKDIEEYRDNEYYNYETIAFSSLFYLPHENAIIDKNDLLNYDTLSLVHDVFYTPSNEIISLFGNFEIDEMISYIESIYDNLSFKNIKVELPEIKEPNRVKIKETNIKNVVNKNYTRISYKINFSKFSPLERFKLSIYCDYLIEENFIQGLNSYLLKNNIIKEELYYNDFYDYDYLVLEIASYTDKKDEFVKIITDKMNNLEFNLDNFLINKNKTIAYELKDELYSTYYLFLDSILKYDYYNENIFDIIRCFSFEDYKLLISKLDFSNYTINNFYKEN